MQFESGQEKVKNGKSQGAGALPTYHVMDIK